MLACVYVHHVGSPETGVIDGYKLRATTALNCCIFSPDQKLTFNGYFENTPEI